MGLCLLLRLQTFALKNICPFLTLRYSYHTSGHNIIPQLTNTIRGALHSSDERYDLPRCYPHTREAILQEIMDWIQDIDRQTRVLWLYRPAGARWQAGKSAIEQTIAELCCQMYLLPASFFFSRSVSDRNKRLHNNNRRTIYRVNTGDPRACW